jgi:sodium-dependent dicarboxylate transporter 2/3/5
MTGISPSITQNNKRRKNIYSFVAVFIIAFVLSWFLKEPSFTDSQVYTLFLLFFSVGLWLTEAIPAFAVALFIMAYLVFTLGNKHFNSSPENIDKYVNTFSSSIIWLLLGGFFLSSAITKTKMDERILRLVLRLSGTKPRNIIIALMFTTMIASMLMSNTATTAMMVASIMPLLRSLGKIGFSKGLLLGVSTGASLGGIGTIIGCPSNAIAAGLLEESGIKIDFLGWAIYGLPLTIILTVICCWALVRRYALSDSSVSFDFLLAKKEKNENGSSSQRTIVMITLAVTILLWLTGSVHGISVAAVSAVPIVVLPLTGILDSNDVKALPWDTLILVAGGLSLGVALESTGILNHYAEGMRSLHLNSLLFLLIIGYAAMLFSNVMSNSAACVVLIPLGMAVLPGWEKEVALTVGLSSCMSILLPVSTPPNAIVYSTGLLEQREFRLSGILVGVLGPLLAILWVLLLKR